MYTSIARWAYIEVHWLTWFVLHNDVWEQYVDWEEHQNEDQEGKGIVGKRHQSTPIPCKAEQIHSLSKWHMWSIPCLYFCWRFTTWQHPRTYQDGYRLVTVTGQLSRASASRFGRSWYQNLVGSNPGRVKPMTLKLIPVASSPGTLHYYIRRSTGWLSARIMWPSASGLASQWGSTIKTPRVHIVTSQ